MEKKYHCTLFSSTTTIKFLNVEKKKKNHQQKLKNHQQNVGKTFTGKKKKITVPLTTLSVSHVALFSPSPLTFSFLYLINTGSCTYKAAMFCQHGGTKSNVFFTAILMDVFRPVTKGDLQREQQNIPRLRGMQLSELQTELRSFPNFFQEKIQLD